MHYDEHSEVSSASGWVAKLVPYFSLSLIAQVGRLNDICRKHSVFHPNPTLNCALINIILLNTCERIFPTAFPVFKPLSSSYLFLQTSLGTTSRVQIRSFLGSFSNAPSQLSNFSRTATEELSHALSQSLLEMKLNTLPPELFESLSRWWDGRHIIKMLMTGDKNVLYRMTGTRGIRHFSWTGRPFLVTIPSLLVYLKTLRTVRLKVKAIVDVKLTSILPKLPPSVESLDMEYNDSIRHFFRDLPLSSDNPESAPFDMDWQDYLPNLHSLRVVEYATTPLASFLLQNLPDHISSFTVIPCRSSYAASMSKPSLPFPTRLPASLEHLELHSRHFLRPEIELEWPPHLTTLRLSKCTWDALPDDFPRTLTELHLGVPLQSNFLAEFEIEAWKPVFAHMRVLEVTTTTPYAFLQVLPEDGTLEKLCFYNQFAPLKLDEVRRVPEGLKHLDSYFERTFKTHLYKLLPRSLEYLNLMVAGDEGCKLHGSAFAELPPNLTALHIRALNPIENDHVALLPRTLTECSIINPSLLSRQALMDLPKAMKKLIFTDESKRLPFDNGDMACLPDALEVLQFDNLEELISDRGLANMPRMLTTLIHTTNTSFTDAGMAWLPPTLTILHLPQNGSIGDKGIARLPRTLTELVLSGDAFMLSTRSFKSLPPRLKGLSIKTIAGMSDIAMKDLPPTITSLILPGGAGITNKLFLYLPRPLRRLVLRNNTTITPRCISDIRSELEFLNLKENPNFANRGKIRKILPSNLTLLSKHNLFKSPIFEKSELVSTQL